MGREVPGRGWGGEAPGISDPGCASPDRSTVIVLAPASYEWFEEWREEPKGKRSRDYETLKTSFVEASLSVVLKLFPQLEGKVGRSRGGGTELLVPFLPFLWGREMKPQDN